MNEALWVLVEGGWASYALAVVSVLLWAALVVRLLTLQNAGATGRGGGALALFIRDAQKLQGNPTRISRLAKRTVRDLGTLRSVVRTLVAVAPLLGLLGTVIGMVEMFTSMQGANVNTESTVAGGISTALISTQLGLVITVPGLLAGHYLRRAQLRRERQVKVLVDQLQRGAA